MPCDICLKWYSFKCQMSAYDIYLNVTYLQCDIFLNVTHMLCDIYLNVTHMLYDISLNVTHMICDKLIMLHICHMYIYIYTIHIVTLCLLLYNKLLTTKIVT